MIACAEPNALGRTQLSPTTSAPRSTKPSPPFSPFPSQTRWTITLDAEIAGPPAFDGSTAYLSLEGDRLGAYDLTTGKLRWDASARPQTTPVTGDGLLFIEQADRLVALRSDNGSVAWEAPVSEQRAAPLVWDNGWLVATTQKALHVFRAVDGTPLWSRDLPSPAHSTPALAGEAVYLSLEDGRVMAFHVTDGAVLWERRLGGAANGIRALEDRLLVGANDNYLYCLNSETGQVVWRSRTGADVVSLAIVADRRVVLCVARQCSSSAEFEQRRPVVEASPALPPSMGADQGRGYPAGHWACRTGAGVLHEGRSASRRSQCRQQCRAGGSTACLRLPSRIWSNHRHRDEGPHLKRDRDRIEPGRRTATDQCIGAVAGGGAGKSPHSAITRAHLARTSRSGWALQQAGCRAGGIHEAARPGHMALVERRVRGEGG